MTQEELKKELLYVPETGFFYRRGHLAFDPDTDSLYMEPDRKVGYKDKRGYIVVYVLRWQYLAHRLAWFYMTGTWPEKVIDHIDRNRSNNKFSNLRSVSQVENTLNTRRSELARARYAPIPK